MGMKRIRAIANRPVSEYGTVYDPETGYPAFALRGSSATRSMFGPTRGLADDQQRANRRYYGYTGRGAYRKKRRYRGRGSYLGNFLGGVRNVGRSMGIRASANSDLGKIYDLGMKADRAIDRYRGRGNYAAPAMAMNANALVNGGSYGSGKIMSRSGAMDETGLTRFALTEKLKTVYAPSADQCQKFRYDDTWEINAGLDKLWSHLAQSSVNFQEYRIVKMVLEYHSSIRPGDFTGNVGKMCFTHTFKPNQRDFLDMDEQANFVGSVTCSPLSPACLKGIECDPKKTNIPDWKFVRTHAIPAGEDKINWDHGKIHLTTKDLPSEFAEKALGDIMVYYVVECRRPKLFSGRGEAIGTWKMINPTPAITSLSSGTFGKGDKDTPLFCELNSLDIKPHYTSKQDAILGGDAIDATPSLTGVALELPAKMAGRYSVQCVGTFADATDTVTPLATSFASGGSVIKHVSNTDTIKPVKDVWDDAVAASSGVHVAGAAHFMSMQTVDIRPQQGTVKNIMFLDLAAQTSAGANKQFDHVTISLTEHNSMTKYAGDEQVLVNILGTVKEHT